MSNPAPDALRFLAALAVRRRLDGRAFPAAVAAYRDPFGVRAVPPAVRHAAGLVRFRGANLSPEGVACVLRGLARTVARGY